jgi:hypothetical protein
MVLKTPQSLKAEHDELHAQLARAIGAGGATGDASAKVAETLQPHFLKRKSMLCRRWDCCRIFLRAGSCLRWRRLWQWPIASSRTWARCFRSQIVTSLKALTEAANSEGKGDAAQFAEKLMLHAQTEEEVLYPASILVGEYLNLKLSEGTGR